MERLIHMLEIEGDAIVRPRIDRSNMLEILGDKRQWVEQKRYFFESDNQFFMKFCFHKYTLGPMLIYDFS